MLRTIIVGLAVVLFLILSLPVLLFEYLLRKRNPALSARQCMAIVRNVFRLLLWMAGTDVVMIGRDNIPEDEPVLYVGNHRSYFDILATYIGVKTPTGYIAKVEMARIPILRKWMELIGCRFLNRGNAKEGLKTILDAIGDVKGGRSVFIFPEGTRNENDSAFDLMEFHEGSIKIAEKSGAKVIPVAIYGSANIFEKHMPSICASKIVVRFGAPVDVKQLPEGYRKKAGLYLKEQIGTMLHEIAGQYPEIRD